MSACISRFSFEGDTSGSWVGGELPDVNTYEKVWFLSFDIIYNKRKM